MLYPSLYAFLPYGFAAPDNAGLYVLHEDAEDGIAQQKGEACQGEERGIAYGGRLCGDGYVMKQFLQPYDIEAVIEVYREAGAGIEVDTASEGGVLIEPAT